MIVLNEKYWKSINKEHTTNKGICFENLVKKLLIAEYGKAIFQGTKGSWDGNKDFFYYSQKNKYWAECKNYASNIDLKVLASTLVMAQLSEIDTILYYSYSAINVNTKAKLLLNANKKGETIYFYDDTVLEQKIFQYWDFVGEQFFPDFSQKDMLFEKSENNFESKCLLYGNPLDLSSTLEGYEIKHLTLFKMFEMDICIINREKSSNTINLGFKKMSQIKAQFDVFPEHMFKLKNEIILAPYEGRVIRLWLIPIKENCIIPTPYINNKKLGLPKNIEFKTLYSQNYKRLIGRSYEQYLSNFKKNVLFDTTKLKMGIFYGNSGTGKTKLFEECLNISKINGYDIVDFVTLNNSKNILSIRDFIQRLLVALYNISIDMLEEIIKVIKFQKNKDLFIMEQPEYCMLADIFYVTNNEEIQQWLKKYLDLIVLKLAKCKFLIAIDNVQFFNNEIIDLLDSICTKLIIVNLCSTKFLFTFNMDYIKKDSKVSKFLSKYSCDTFHVFTEHITGFKSPEECYEFLQESFSIGEIFQKTDIEYIIKNLNSNPFYLEQMIYWLQEKDALELDESSLRIKNHILFKRLIRNIPNTVYDILSERWNYYKEHSATEIEKECVLFSAIHLYNELTKTDIDKLKIPWELVVELEKMGFITIEDTTYIINVKYRHDLIDIFFSKIYPRFSKLTIYYENKLNVVIRNNNIRIYMERLYDTQNTVPLSNAYISECLSLHVESRLCYEFYLIVFEKIIENFSYNYSENEIKCINNVYKIIILIHDILGNDIMNECVNALLNQLKNTDNIFNYIEYGNLLLYIGEAYDSMGKYKDAVQLIKDYKERTFGCYNKKSLSMDQKKMLSQVYNRLHVYLRHQVATPLENNDIMNYLEKSSRIADEISDEVMQYVNYSDRGYLYYNLPLFNKEHSKTISYWKKACDVYEKGNAKTKYINYLRKKTQLALLEGDSEKAVQVAQKGLDEIDVSPYAYQQTFFKWWFYHALAEAYLLCYKIENAEEIEKALERALFYSDLIESNKKFYYLQLKAVYMYYTKRYDVAIELNDEAIKLIDSSNYRSKVMSIKSQLDQNKNVFLLRDIQHDIYSQIHTKDGLFNLPCM